MQAVSFDRVSAESLGQVVAGIVDLYSVVYAEPPYEEGPDEVASFASRLPSDARRPGFDAWVAVAGDTVVGATHGWTMAAGSWWSRADQPAPAELLGADKFAVMEWIVHPTRRGIGVGAALIQRLLGNRPEPWAVLASDPRSAAREIYTRAGWRAVGTTTLPWGPAMDLLSLRLPQGASVRHPGD